MVQSFSIEVNRNVYDDVVISQVVYWHSDDFVITRNVNDNTETITLHPRDIHITNEEKERVLQQFQQDLNDFKLRQIVAQETKDIRTILYIKAFANNDDFVDYE
ncbi:MAG: His-Xaa-Ser system protein HxsD [Bacteroidales bacterium]|nr:His-Xaa-Ser system protein HxsD [Bacteroidales bacterium]